MPWGSEVEVERRNRIRLAVWAYAYEICNDSLVDDHTFDELAKQIRPEIKTGENRLDQFFATEFHPDTGMWIRRHPAIAGIRTIYRRMKNGFEDERTLETGSPCPADP